MGLFGSHGGGRSKRSEDDTETQTSDPMNDHDHALLDEEAQEVMAENLDLMKDIVMRIREDPDFASSIYQDCPRLQHLLDDRPDLRPIFEDPYLVRINFEQVYRAAGGKLPEDEEKENRLGCVKKALVKFVNSPFFKVLRALLLIKKIYACATGSSISTLRNLLTRCGCQQLGCCQPDPSEAAANQTPEVPDDGEYAGNPQNAALRESLYAAANHMEDPEVAEQMNDLLDNDPEGLQEAIENDPDLRALRDSSPLCAELMSDPETMRVLVDPDNLRALGDCPDLIEQDFADPNWMPPDIETGSMDGDEMNMDASSNVDQPQNVTSTNVDHSNNNNAMSSNDAVPVDHLSADGVADAVDTDGDGIADDMDEDDDGDGVLDDEEVVEEEEAPEYELGDKEDSGGNNNNNAKGGGNKSKQQQQQKNGGGGGGFMSQVTAGLTDMIAGEIVGTSMGDIMGGGGDDELAGLDSAADQAADQAADSADQASSAAADNLNSAAAAASMIPGDELAQVSDQIETVGAQMDNLESGLDQAEDAADQANGPDGNNSNANNNTNQPTGGQIAGSVVEDAIIFGPCFMPGDKDKKEGQDGVTTKSFSCADDDEEDAPEKKSRFGFIGNFAGAVGGAAKETLMGAVLGSDLAEWAMEKEEEKAAKKEEQKKEKNEASEGAKR